MDGRRAPRPTGRSVASLPATSTPCSREHVEEDARVCRRTARRLLLDVGLVAPGSDATRVGRTPAASRRSPGGAPSAPRSASASPATNPLRYPVIDERLLSVLSTTTLVRSPSCRRAPAGPSSNHSSLYASSEASSTSCAAPASAASRQERERRHRAGRVVRVVQPQRSPARSHMLVGDAVEVGQEAALLVSGRRSDLAAGEPRAPFGDRVAGRGRRARDPCPRRDRGPPARARRRAPSSRASAGSACRGRASRRTADRPMPRWPRAAPAGPPRAGTRRSGSIAVRERVADERRASPRAGRPRRSRSARAAGVERLALAPVELLERIRLDRCASRVTGAHLRLPLRRPGTAATRSGRTHERDRRSTRSSSR